MGLRINNNSAANSALRNLRIADRKLQSSMERLSTGLRINRASDDPSGLVISEQLRAQIASLHQAQENSENANNLIGTAEAALSEVSNLLIGIRESVVFALNSGGAGPEQIQAEQDGVDQALAAIDKIAGSTRFGRTQLLDGSSAFKVTGANAVLSSIDIRSMNFDGFESRTITVRVLTAARQASKDTAIGAAAAITNAAGQVTFQVAGNRGAVTLTLGASATAQQFTDAVNLVALDTGVYVSADAGSQVLRSIDFGEDAFITVTQVGGSGAFLGATITAPGTTEGTDVGGTINGVLAAGAGTRLSINTEGFNVGLDLDVTATGPSHASNTNYTFRVLKSGLNFQLGSEATPRDAVRIGLQSISTAHLGGPERALSLGGGATVDIGGVLASLRTGGAADLLSDPTQAQDIVDKAIDDVSGVRAYLGALQSQFIEPNIDTLGIAIENLTASESVIRDLDFAAETVNFTSRQIQLQAATAVLASANLQSQNVLTLLQ